MNDRELLEMAAKAAGFDWVDFSSEMNPALGFPANCQRGYWHPLADDGDALRLAVKLGIERIFVLRLGPNGVCVDSSQDPQIVPVFEHALYRVVFDQYAATRRAIVRASAAIGRRMP